MYRLSLLKESVLVDVNLDNELKECDELVRILTAIVKKTQHSLPNTNHSKPNTVTFKNINQTEIHTRK